MLFSLIIVIQEEKGSYLASKFRLVLNVMNES